MTSGRRWDFIERAPCFKELKRDTRNRHHWIDVTFLTKQRMNGSTTDLRVPARPYHHLCNRKSIRVCRRSARPQRWMTRHHTVLLGKISSFSSSLTKPFEIRHSLSFANAGFFTKGASNFRFPRLKELAEPCPFVRRRESVQALASKIDHLFSSLLGQLAMQEIVIIDSGQHAHWAPPEINRFESDSESIFPISICSPLAQVILLFAEAAYEMKC